MPSSWLMPPWCISKLYVPDSFRIALEECKMVFTHGMHVVDVILQVNIGMIQIFQYLDQLFAIVDQKAGHIFCVDSLENDLDSLVKKTLAA